MSELPSQGLDRADVAGRPTRKAAPGLSNEAWQRRLVNLSNYRRVDGQPVGAKELTLRLVERSPNLAFPVVAKPHHRLVSRRTRSSAHFRYSREITASAFLGGSKAT
jgi:hypothetical protein